VAFAPLFVRPFFSSAITSAKISEGSTWSSYDTAVLRSVDSRVCVVESDDFKMESIELASKLSLDLVPKEMIFDSRASVDSSRWGYSLLLEPFCISNVDENKTYALSIQPLHNELSKQKRRPSKQKRKASPVKPFFVDFSPPLGSRLGKRLSGGEDLLVKAAGPRKGVFAEEGAIVYDLTAGFGQDALLLANAGAAKVVMFERNPIVGALLQDALRRLGSLANSLDDIDGSMQQGVSLLSDQLFVEIGDGQQMLAERFSHLVNEHGRCDIVYLDPMFPTRTKSAAVKKNMQILHGLLESQTIDGSARQQEECTMLETALQAASNRVVVKRPVGAPVLGGPDTATKPSYQIKGSVNRWDVYSLL